MHPHSEVLATLRATLRREGVRGLMIHLNGLTQYRFSSLYRFDKDQLQSLCFYDRENPAQLSTPSLPVMASYCGVPLVGEDGRIFGTICHFDLVPRARGVDDLELLEAVATLLNERFAETLSDAAPGGSRG